MSSLFHPLSLRGVTFENRVVVSPMCQYSSVDGFANDWHLVHLGSRAVGGAGLVITEAAAVDPDGRITPSDLGIYRDEHVAKLAEIVAFLNASGAVAGIQLAHAGRKASSARPWDGGGPVGPADGGWDPVAPSAIAYDTSSLVPHALSLAAIERIRRDFVDAARRAIRAGFRVVEIHAAHGYLLHEFLSPLSNARTDGYGGSFENRTRLTREIAGDVRGAIPDDVPLFVRISATDWVAGGWTIEESVALSAALAPLGVDLIDVSSGGLSPRQEIATGPHYQVPFAARIRRETGIATGAVGMIAEPRAAAAIVEDGEADLVLLARELLRDPQWPLHAATALGVDVRWPVQYARAKPRIEASALHRT